MRMTMKAILARVCFLTPLVLGLFLSTDLNAQSRFSAVVQVGEEVITRHQLDQRTQFLSLLGAPGDPRDLAKEQLINETLQMRTAREAGIVPSDEEVQTGYEEFAGRANLTPEEFFEALGANGVQPETFRDFITAGVAWRTFVRDRLGQTGRNIPEDVIDRQYAETGTEGGVRVLVSEVLLPATTPEAKRASRQRASLVASLDNEEAFAAAAREFSIAPSSANGGQLNWIALSDLPPHIAAALNNLTPGQISRPIEIENAVGVFLLRDIERVEAGTPDNIEIEYAIFRPDGGMAALREASQDADNCDDLYGLAYGMPEDRLSVETTAAKDLPADVRAAIASMDPNETSMDLVRGGQNVLLMLCKRAPATESTIDRNIVANRILNVRLATLAADHLTEIRARTRVIDLTN